MKYLGIDYGTKKIGLAISDTNGTIAFPHSIIPTASKESEIEKVIVKEKIGEIVLGKSLDLKGQSNKVQEDINDFAAYIGMQFGLPVHFVKEFFSSSEARHATKSDRQREKPVASPRRGEKKSALNTENIDAKAAAIILQRHLDTIQLKNK
jgi:putative Holliday junction resolvase